MGADLYQRRATPGKLVNWRAEVGLGLRRLQDQSVRSLDRAPAGYELNDQHDQRDDQQQVN